MMSYRSFGLLLMVAALSSAVIQDSPTEHEVLANEGSVVIPVSKADCGDGFLVTDCDCEGRGCMDELPPFIMKSRFCVALGVLSKAKAHCVKSIVIVRSETVASCEEDRDLTECKGVRADGGMVHLPITMSENGPECVLNEEAISKDSVNVLAMCRYKFPRGEGWSKN